MKKNSYAALIFLFAATLCAAPSHAKDVGVCVQIIEHNESELLGKDTEKNADPQDRKSKTKRSADKKSRDEKPSINKEDKISLQSEKTSIDSLPPSTQTETDAKSSAENTPDKIGDVPAEPSTPTEQKNEPNVPKPPPVPQGDDKDLAAARSNFEMVNADAVFDPEIDNLPYGQTALVYLKRLFEHFVTHESGYASTSENCEQTITVELYPLKRGWTAFARYSGTNREERVDQLYATELSQFAERSVLALLNDVPISATIKRDNVLSSDSKRQVQQVRGTNHFTLNIGTKLVGGKVDQVQTSGENAGSVEEEFQLFHPMKFGLGYRGRFENWGLEVQAGLGIGVGKKAASSNPEGGHIDYGGDTGMAIHFLHYRDPRGLVSFYVGGGAGFDFIWFSAINAADSYDTRSYLYAGGLSGDGIFGWEFLRAASVQFFIQGEVNLPLYIARSEKNEGSVSTWMPGVSFKLGVVF